jgi:hypothetical protein
MPPSISAAKAELERHAMTAGADQQREWVERVLGVRLADPAKQGGGDIVERFRDARAQLLAASDAVNGQIDGLAAILRGSDDEDLRDIANTGLMTVTVGFRTKLLAALADMGDGTVDKLRKNGTKAASFAEKLQAQIDGDGRVIACDTNRYGASVAIRATLGPALQHMAQVLRAASEAA